MYGHWMKRISQKAREFLEKSREAMERYYNQHAKQQPDLKVGDLIMLNAKNIGTKRHSPKLAHRLYGPFKILKQEGNLAYKLQISDRWKIHPVFHVSLLEPCQTFIRPAREQPPLEPEEIDGDLEWEVEKIVKSEIISYERRVRGRPRTL